MGVWLAGYLNPPSALSLACRFFNSASEIRMLALPLLRSMRTLSPVCRIARPPLAAASGVALRIDGEPEVPDCRPSPMHGREVMPRLINAAGGCMLTTSAPPG